MAAAEWMNELALHSGMGGAKEKSDKDAIWVSEHTDKLTMAIALREWDKAAALVEEGQHTTVVYYTFVSMRFNCRRSKEGYSTDIGA